MVVTPKDDAAFVLDEVCLDVKGVDTVMIVIYGPDGALIETTVHLSNV